ncbi:hypothetical protein [Kutzneria buriramensis]|uniref:Uncharacterized protein n=1 Tax=Kutzneria buriramensis TaxID=1045776 RepID=A0A3E0GYK3_9PSEU|nr:hypothetical protein [Kutzneria buriramensis]REH34851.1 hypothetical protein BCF44_119127 [Kutzneria buriramensis]
MSTTTQRVIDDRRYADLRDRRLAAALAAEDAAETDGLDPLERMTCGLHRKWIHRCVHSPMHVIPVTGHRWCRDCSTAADVMIDELTGEIRVTCPGCRRTPNPRATKQIVRTCRASLSAASA